MKHKLIEYSIVCLITSLCWSIAYAKKLIRREIKVVEVTRVEEHRIDKETLVRAFIQVESEGNDKAINRKTNAVGCLQIRKPVIQDANRILGKERYKMSDRTNRAKSVEMFHIMMEHYNPKYDLHLAAKTWNPTSGSAYHRKIEKAYNELIKEDRL